MSTNTPVDGLDKVGYVLARSPQGSCGGNPANFADLWSARLDLLSPFPNVLTLAGDVNSNCFDQC